MLFKAKFSSEDLGNSEPFKITHSMLNTTESNQSETLSVLALKVESIGMFITVYDNPRKNVS